jgi:hypothetical protein
MESNTDQTSQLELLNDVECVVGDTNKFKLKLGIGEDAFTSLKLAKSLQSLWDLKGAAGAGAAAAATPAVAATFFASTAGPLSFLGIGAAAATPVGWVMGAAVLSGGAYYGAMRMIGNFNSSRVDSIPKFINTPIDLLGATIFDMMAGLSLKVASLSHSIDDVERSAVIDYFVEEWGLSTEYTQAALPLIETSIHGKKLKDMAGSLAEFQLENPDCNPTQMRKDIKSFLEEIAYSDGDYSEVEELAIEAVENILNHSLAGHRQIAKSATDYAKMSAGALGNAASSASKVVDSATKNASSMVKAIWKKKS